MPSSSMYSPISSVPVTLYLSRFTLRSENIDNFSYTSTYNLKRIKNLYSNLDTISFWEIKNEIKEAKQFFNSSISDFDKSSSSLL